MEKTDRIALRLDTGMKPALEALAAADHRTLSSLVAKILSDWLQTQAPPSQQVHQ